MRGRWGEETDEMMAPPLSHLIAAAAATLVKKNAMHKPQTPNSKLQTQTTYLSPKTQTLL